jgi:hypothetical protein
MSYQELIKAVDALVESPPSPETVAPEERLTLLASLDKLRNAVETPMDATFRIVLGVSSSKLLLDNLEWEN